MHYTRQMLQALWGASLTMITCVYILCVINVCYSIDYNDSHYRINEDWRDSLPWPFSLLCTSNSIIHSSPNQIIWSAITNMWRWRQRFTSLACLSSLVSLSFTSVTFSSLSKPLFPHQPLYTHSLYMQRTKLSQNLNSSSIIFYHSHSLYTRRTKPWQTTTSVVLAQACSNNYYSRVLAYVSYTAHQISLVY